LLVLLPFEPPYFDKAGLATTYIGHPVVESGADRGDGAAFRARHGIAADAPLLTILPGSRRGEVKRLLTLFGDTATLLVARFPTLRLVVPTLSHVAARVREARWPVAPIVVEDETEKFAAFAASNVALAASGTVALELAMAHLPAVIAYRLNPLTYEIVRRMVSVDYANLVNLLLGREAVPEFVRNDATPERLAAAVSGLLDDSSARAAQVAAYDQALGMLGQGGEPPGQRAAQQILGMI
jgi:lipid-A-disaccharide synthase